MLQRLGFVYVLVNSALYAACTERKTSLTFVIDDTKSMHDDIAQVRMEVKAIMNMVLNKTTLIDDIILITFNDPDVELRTKTNDTNEFIRRLGYVEPYNDGNNYDCPEYSMGGIQKALTESKPGSYIYVFTDATASDYRKATKIKDLCQKTQSRVIFVLTGNCRKPNSKGYKVYHEVAIASSGLVMEVNKNEVGSVVKAIDVFIEGNTNPVTSVVIPARQERSIPFTVDEKTEYIIISGTGKYINMKVDGPHVHPEKAVWTTNSKMLQLIKPAPGNYTVIARSKTDAHVAVYARTNFAFQHGFSKTKPKSIDDASRKPIAGEENRLSIMVEDPSDSVKIDTAQIMNMAEEPIGKPLPLTEIGDNFYITDSFVSPEVMFKLAVNGHFIDNGKTIRSLAKTPINPEIVERPDLTRPTATISEGDRSTAIFSGSMVLTCKVHAYPDPAIIWTDKYGHKFVTTTSVIEKPYEFISYLQLTGVTKSNEYYCEAINKLGRDMKSIHVEIGDPFKVTKHPEEKTLIKYGQRGSIKCVITSDAKMKINWYFNDVSGTKKLRTDGNYVISPDGIELTIKSMTKELVGTYTCNAALTSDEYINKRLSTNVEVYGFDVPMISNSVRFLNAQDLEPVTVPCQIIQGLPKPTIKWQYRTRGSFVDLDLTGNIEIKDDGLHIPHSHIQHSGEYKCIAVNDAGTDEHITTLTVNKKPENKIIEGAEIKIKYNDDIEVSCTATGNPPPEIEWRDENGMIVAHKQRTIRVRYEYLQSSTAVLKKQRKSKKIYCHALNTLGNETKAIDIVVRSPFEVITHPKVSLNVSYGEEKTISCDVKSLFSVKITWYYTDEKTNVKTKISPSTIYEMLSNGAVLKIKSMNLDTAGKYTCEASLLSNEDEKVYLDTELQIQGLKIPKVEQLTNAIKIMDNSPAAIECKILEGHPKPAITWQFQKKGTHDFMTIRETGEILRIKNVGLDRAGNYRCIAENVLGKDIKVTELLVEKIPAIQIVEGRNITVRYGTDVVMTCEVFAYPPPRVVWTESKGNELPSKIDIKSMNEYKYPIKLANIKKSEQFRCHASNNLGDAYEIVDLIVESPFEVQEKPKLPLNVSYGEEKIISCDVKSHLPMKITWYYTDEKINVKKKISPSTKYEMLSNGAVLKIQSMNLYTVGKYTCEVSLLSNADEKVYVDTELQIQGLEIPKLEQLPNALKVMDNTPTAIECKILEGHPKPAITWEFQKKGTHDFRPIAETSEILRIKNAGLDRSGNYICVAQNVLGKAIKVTELLVEKIPAIQIVEGNNITVHYGTDVILTCEVFAYPSPQVVWTESKGNELPSKMDIKSTNDVYIYPIKIANIKKSEQFRCHASNNLGEADEIFDVTVESPFEVQEKPQPKVYVEYGKAHTIKCHIKSFLNINIKWYRIPETKGMKRLIKPSDKYSLSADGTELTVSFMEPTLDGAYGCVASLVDDEDERISYVTKIKTTGLAPVEIDKSNVKLNRKLKSDVEILCRIQKGNPKPDIKWYFKNDLRSVVQPLNTTGEVLTISEVSLNDAGNYLCVAENLYGKAQHVIELIVEAPPEIKCDTKTTVQTAVVGDVVLKIPCIVTGYPKPTISWKVNGLDIVPDSKYSIVDGALLVRTPQEIDSLNYTCVAKNTEGENSVNFVGIVTPRITEYENVKNINVLNGTSKKVNCLLPHTGSDKIRWFQEYEVMNNTQSYIYLENATVSMDGNYSCRVSNENGYTMETYVVNVGYPPSFQSYQENEIIDWEGDESVMDCYVDAKPDATIQWFYEGKPMKLKQNILQLHISAWGQYMCQVTNAHGSVDRSFNVTSSACLINIKNESVDKAPLLLTENLKWPNYMRNMDFLVIPHKDNVVFSCNEMDTTPTIRQTKEGLTNWFKAMPDKNNIKATCAGTDTFSIDGKLYRYSDLRCDREVMANVERTGETCFSDDTEMVEVGYKLDEFVTVYRVCLDTKNNVPLYTRVIMIDSNNVIIPSKFEWSKIPGITLVNNETYTCLNNISCCIRKEQFVSYNDVTFGPAMRSTFLEQLNAFPVWQYCDNFRMSWRQLEDRIRDQYNTNSQFAIWTGAADYIKSDKGYIPQYLWKVVKFDESESMAIIYVNDPYPKDSQVRCKNTCGPGDESWFVSQDKYTYCCELEDFLTSFNIPEEAVGGI